MLLGGLPSVVTAKVRTRLHKIEVEDEGAAVLEYPNGAWGYYYASTCEFPSGQRIEISGDKGKLVFAEGILKLYSVNPPISEHNATNKSMWNAPEMKEETLELPQAEYGHKEIIKNFCAAILHSEELISPGVQAIWSVEFINAMNLSGRTGKPVKIPVSRKKYDKLLDGLKSGSMDKRVEKAERVTDPRFNK
jgi:predicted dehydrogenase